MRERCTFDEDLSLSVQWAFNHEEIPGQRQAFRILTVEEPFPGADQLIVAVGYVQQFDLDQPLVMIFKNTGQTTAAELRQEFPNT